MLIRCVRISAHAKERLLSRFTDWDDDALLYCINHIAKPDHSWKNNSHMLLKMGETSGDVFVYKEMAFIIKNRTLVTILYGDWLHCREIPTKPRGAERLYGRNAYRRG